MDFQAELRELEPKQDYLVAIDSDGCAFDTMEIKHKECFIPNIVRYWDLQPVSKFARAAAEFVNLYSEWRGINRFPALTMVFDLLGEWPEVQRRKAAIPRVETLREWMQRESKLGNPALQLEVDRTGDPVLRRALEWSEAVNRTIAELVHGIPPFPSVPPSLERMADRADIIVCSATPIEALRREWEEHGIDRFVRVIAGQEMGSKKEHLQLAIGERYPVDRVLMLGDAPGDLRAARANGARFFPINPGHEEESWARFLGEGVERFFAGDFDDAYENDLISEFQRLLPSVPPWAAQEPTDQ
ncbi:MAG: HAD family hydrolase [Acidobacteriota bacterium]|jgi:phosphoglycolate phosphatase-like HAD superfamily hydrolase